VNVAARYRARGPAPPASGCRLPGGAGDHIAVFDDLGRELVTAVAPPFVSPAAYERYGGVAERRPGLDLLVEWRIRRWPEHGDARWMQVFRDGVERDGFEGGDPPGDGPPDVIISCDYRDLARFLLGTSLITNADGPVRIEKGGVTELSCLGGLVLDDRALRHVALPADIRHLVAEGVAQL
jgi:hypothetical protein